MRWQRPSDEGPAAKLKRRHALLGVGMATLVVVLLVAWLLIDDNGSEQTQAGSSTAAEVVSVESLRSTAAEQETPLYWAGPPEGSELELSQPSFDRTYVRYLTGGAEAGDQRPFLTVGSYLLPDPVAALRAQGEQPDGVLVSAPGGGIVYFSKERPESVYLAYPDTGVEVEVYAPNFQQALQLVTSGRIVPVE